MAGWMVTLGAGAGFPPWLTPEVQVLAWTVVVFLILAGVLWKFAWGPIMHALEQREKNIQKRIDDAETKFREAEARVKEYEQKIHKAKDEAAEVIAEGKRDVEKLREDILAEAGKEAALTLDRAKREITLARDAAVASIQERTVKVAAEMAAKVLEREVNAEDHKHFIEDAIREAGKN
jgi:F-type H+-transporting ATPase subunit b